MGEFQAVAKCAAGSDDGITKAQRANGNAKVNISQRSAGVGRTWGSHFEDENSTNEDPTEGFAKAETICTA